MHHGIKHPVEGHDVWRGIAAGAIGGLAAAWAMNMFQLGMSKVKEKVAPEQSPGGQSGGENATVKTARAISESVGHELQGDEKNVAGSVVHYAFGTAMGALYGLLSEVEPRAKAGFGTGFGAALWLGADEIMVPALKLSAKATEFPWTVHANALASHLVYGAALEGARRGARAALGHDWSETGEEAGGYARESWPVKYVLRKAA